MPESEDLTAYPKIPGPFWRDPATNQLTEKWATPELEATAGLLWRFTEKVDGTNIRVIWDGHRVTFGGRTLRAHLPIPLHEHLQATFGGEDHEVLFEQKFGGDPAVLYGEGYGAGIQTGGKYAPAPSFVLFDVLVGGRWWLQRDDVEDVGRYFGIERVPIVYRGTLVQAVEKMRHDGLVSAWGDFPAEGLVGVTEAGLRGRNGERLIVKVKSRDFAPKR